MNDFTLTGRHVAAIFIGAFSIIIGVNIALAISAVQTFPGLEVKNSYVASQNFDADRSAQNALGWKVSAMVTNDVLSLRIDDATGPVNPTFTQATLGRATHVKADREVTFHFNGRDHTAPTPDLPRGNWNLRLVAVAEDGTEFRQRIVVEVSE